MVQGPGLHKTFLGDAFRMSVAVYRQTSALQNLSAKVVFNYMQNKRGNCVNQK